MIHTVFPLHILDEKATVGERIRFYRMKRHMTGNMLAQKCGISRYAIMDYESGETEPDLLALKRIASVLEINADNLYDEYYRFLAYPYSKKLKEMRKQMKLTQKEFGNLFGVGRKTVERWESGEILTTRERYYEIGKVTLPAK